MKLTRRQFIQRTAVAGAAATLLPRVALPFGQSPVGIPKFDATLPGLGSAGANNYGNYIEVLTPDQVTYPGTDYYHIFAKQFTQTLHPSIGSTTFWGYSSSSTGPGTYLGGVIVAKRGTPVKLRVTNVLPVNHILPVDWTAMDPTLTSAFAGRNDRIAVHLHGGFVHWVNDGGPFAWYANPSNGGYVKGPSFMNTGGAGSAIYDYPNLDCARFLWYHDHAYGITRVNAYAGLATAYLITDDPEQNLVANGTLPNIPGYSIGIPLVIQDKTFFDPAKDPSYNVVVPAAQKGWLWYPHQYESPNDQLVQGLPSMTLFSTQPVPKYPNKPLTYKCAQNGPGNWTGRWDNGAALPSQINSLVAESFGDIMLVNGAPYPRLPVAARRYRFRILNPSNARFLNLQLYVADKTPNGITLVQGDQIDPNGNPLLVPNNAPGPAFIQVGNESGFLRSPAVFAQVDPKSPSGFVNQNSNLPMGFNPGMFLNDPTVGDANRYNLLMAPAERCDIIIDFRGFEGKNLILYTDAPAPFPGGDIRNDYFPGDADLTCIGGAPSTPMTSAVGPDTRIIMRFEVAKAGSVSELSFDQTIIALSDPSPTSTTGLLAAFTASQDPIPNITGVVPKVKSLNEDFDQYGRLRQRLGTNVLNPPSDPNSGGGPDYGVDLLAYPTEIARAGETQVWDVYNTTGDTHPMHFHLVDVVVIERQPFIDPGNGDFQNVGNSRGPDANENGYKETVRMNPGERTRVAMTFTLPPGNVPPSPRLNSSFSLNGAEYVWHCHILDHEEHDMMRPLVVV